MYFPILRGKQFELSLLSDSHLLFQQASPVYPIVEPIRTLLSSETKWRQFRDRNIRFGLIVNPSVGELLGRELYPQIGAVAALSEGEHVQFFYRVSANTTATQIRTFREWHGRRGGGIFVASEPADRDALAELKRVSAQLYYLVRVERISEATLNALRGGRCVAISDPFVPRARNADFPDQEFFTDRHRTFSENNYVGFGDYSIVGDRFRDGGGAAHAVAIHHLMFDGAHRRRLIVRHFLSDDQEGTENRSGKEVQAMSNLVNAVRGIEHSDTPTCAEYARYVAQDKARGLGYLKKMQMRHHVELMHQYFSR